MSKKAIKPLPVLSTPLPEPAPKFRRPHTKFKDRLTMKKKRIIVGYAKTGDIRKTAQMAKTSPGYVSHVINSPRGQYELAPVIDLLGSHRNAVLEELKRREPVLPMEDYKTLISAVDVLTKNHQLLSGGATENVAVADVTEKYNALINAVRNGEEIINNEPPEAQNEAI